MSVLHGVHAARTALAAVLAAGVPARLAAYRAGDPGLGWLPDLAGVRLADALPGDDPTPLVLVSGGESTTRRASGPGPHDVRTRDHALTVVVVAHATRETTDEQASVVRDAVAQAVREALLLRPALGDGVRLLELGDDQTSPVEERDRLGRPLSLAVVELVVQTVETIPAAEPVITEPVAAVTATTTLDPL